jgi:hypothetical protein
MSVTVRSRPMRYALWRWIWSRSEEKTQQQVKRSCCKWVAASCRKRQGGRRGRDAPTCSSPLKTYSLHPTRGLRASGGSLYLSNVLVPSEFLTVFVAAASKPDGAKLGFTLSSGAGVGAGDSERDWSGPRSREWGRERESGRECRGDAERRRGGSLGSSSPRSRRSWRSPLSIWRCCSICWARLGKRWSWFAPSPCRLRYRLSLSSSLLCLRSS